MNADQIKDVYIYYYYGFTFYRVTLIDDTVTFVPDDPQNADYAGVQEWLALHGGDE